MINAEGFCGAAYEQIIVFRNREEFLNTVAANRNMEAIIGHRTEDCDNFPGVYIAGIKSSLHRDNSVAHPYKP